MNDNSRGVLVGDLGGTNVRFAISDLDELTIDHFAALRTADFASPQAALQQYLRSIPNPPARVALSVAGPVSGDRARMTHLAWDFSKEDIRKATGAEKICLVNNFHAVAMMVPLLTEVEMYTIPGGTLDEYGPKAIVGPGTGLGVAGLLHQNGAWPAIASEGGHMSFGGMDRAELDLLDQLYEAGTYRSAEQVLCGAGMVALYRVIAQQMGQASLVAEAPQVIKALASGKDAAARATVAQFARWLGRFAGDVALQFAATGGVYLGGGIPPAIVAQLSTREFRAAFEDKGSLSGFMSKIPIKVIRTKADSGLRGAALAMFREEGPAPRTHQAAVAR
jgi:glucokinase